MQIGGQLRTEAPVNGGRNYRLTAVVPRTNLAICWDARCIPPVLAARPAMAEGGGSENLVGAGYQQERLRPCSI
jgi:hypothetical protein